MKNIIINYFSIVLMGGVTIVLIPIYLGLLGKEQWGVVAICISVQGLMGLLDVGVSQLMPRDIARVSCNPIDEARTFKKYLQIYLVMGGAGFIIVQILLQDLVSYWILDATSSSTNIVVAIRVVLLQFFFQFVNNANLGFWNGIQAQVKANAHTCVFFFMKHALAIVFIVYLDNSALSYVIAFALCSFLEVSVNLLSLFFVYFKNIAFSKISLKEYLSIFGETIKFGGGVAIGIFTFQLDRVILPKFVELSAFGYYLVVLNIGLAFFQLQYPMVRALLPHISKQNPIESSESKNRLALYLVGCCCLPCLVAIIFSPIILDVWLHDENITHYGTLPLRIILLSIAFNSLYQIVYLRIISFGRSSVVFKINFVVFMLVLPFSVLLIQQFAVVGAACIWLLAATIQLFSGLVWLHYHKKNS